MIAGYKLINPHTKQPTGFVEKIENGTKIHTIRRGERWSKAFENKQTQGRYLCIQHSTGVRTKNFKTFKWQRVVSVQKVVIDVKNGSTFGIEVMIDGKLLMNLPELACNDGFDYLFVFCSWFRAEIKANGPFIGEIIHWTDLKYSR
jgi:hypothetical protein